MERAKGRSSEPAIPGRRAASSCAPIVLGCELADHSLGLVVEGGNDLVGVLFRVVKARRPTARSTTS